MHSEDSEDSEDSAEVGGRRYNGINHPDEYSQVFGVGTRVLGAAAVLKRVVASEGVAYPVFQN